MSLRRKYKRPKRRGKKINTSNAGPIIAFFSTIIGGIAVIALFVIFALPVLLPLIGIEFEAPWQPTPTPQPTIKPTPTPHPIKTTDVVNLQQEIVLPTERLSLEYRWFADPYCDGKRIVFAGGKLIDNNIYMDALFLLNMDTNEVESIDAERKHQDFVYPKINEKWLVYLDSKPDGGGAIRVRDMQSGETRLVKEVYTGQPRLHLDGDILAWMERTGSRMDKIFVCDLNTLENTTVQMFNNTPYGQSDISLKNGELVYAYENPQSEAEGGITGITSAIYSVDIASGKTSVYGAGTYAHDPLTNGEYWAWRDGLHGESDSLYYAKGGSSSQKLVENIVDFGISDTFIAYSRNNEPIMVYLLDGASQPIAITPDIERERTQLLGVSGGVVMWMDVTSRERDILKYVKVD